MSEKEHTEWMYNSTDKPDLEQYLLGRRIDSAVDPTQETNTPTDWVSGAVPAPGDMSARAEMWKTRDAFAKAREDPMFIIEKQKRNAHVDLKNNPLKMQKIRDLLASELKKDLKKKKKRRKSGDEGGSSQGRRDSSPGKSRSRDHGDRSRDRGDRSRDRRSHSRDRTDNRGDRKERSSGKRTGTADRKRERSRSPRSSKPHPDKPTGPAKHPTTGPAKNPIAGPAKPRPVDRRGGSGISKKLTPAELEKKRAEMQGDASSRDLERRAKLVGKKDTEISDTVGNKEGGAAFVQKFKVESYSSSTASVEGRIKSNIFSKQRTKTDMKNFLNK